MVTYTPISFYLTCNIEELNAWMNSTNEVIEKAKKENGGE